MVLPPLLQLPKAGFEGLPAGPGPQAMRNACEVFASQARGLSTGENDGVVPTEFKEVCVERLKSPLPAVEKVPLVGRVKPVEYRGGEEASSSLPKGSLRSGSSKLPPAAPPPPAAQKLPFEESAWKKPGVEPSEGPTE